MLLFLALGSQFGASTNFAASEKDAFDRRAVALSRAFIAAELARHAPLSRVVYPGQDLALDLRACLVAAGAQYPSRLGIGIRPDCGTWFAVRAAVATTLHESHERIVRELYPPLPPSDGGPCHTCADAPCRGACPVRAIETTLNLDVCIAQRLREHSPCEFRCGAREACPVGREFMYPRHQIEYHYGVSLTMIRRWSAKVTGS